MTVRLGQMMHVNPNYFDEYEKRHRSLPTKFPQMKKALKEAGAHNIQFIWIRKQAHFSLILKLMISKSIRQLLKPKVVRNGGTTWLS